MIQRGARFSGVSFCLCDGMIGAAALNDPVHNCANIFFIVYLLVKQARDRLVMSIVGVFLQGIDQGQRDHALAQIVAGGLADG